MSNFKEIISHTPVFDNILRSARMIAATDVTVLIKGETGTGKEVLARAIQKDSHRSEQPFVCLNCAALPESLIESELFGHKKGSFTGAISDKKGIFQAADGGTLFLDEINSLPTSIQAKLLRFLESGECLAVGDIAPYTVDVRIISATNSNLQQQIDAGNFREDLYYRLNVIPLEIPALKERIDDLEHLLKHFSEHFAKQHSRTPPKFSKQAIKILQNYDWPGNVRELRNLCERTSVLYSGQLIDAENFPHDFFATKTSTANNQDFALPEVGLNLNQLEADLIHQALQRTNGNRAKSARLLGLSRDTLLYRIQKHGLAKQ
ncbi:MAG: sigma-54-dependent Fis family transcriptional regulator [Gammaproteobacteria bacterium]|nr:sigma-54-dependent Fis family transcriptional regulator [Gammaproteobacteria bacterium]MBT6419254.1 sigma-54-dependent Fis family transcriptional regulator [Gammaproteobacteria bacterium]MBT6575482.1 sigma-54-dependent Fis family transcriptional regulator [Gammaproteobacteria bacterium]